MFATKNFWKDRLQASGIHLCISLAIALTAGLVVFLIWYPYPYRDISGGRELFLLVTGVDVVMGPLLTLCVFNKKKPRSELVRDLAIIGLLQLSALGYGLWTVAAARPVHLVFEIDRFRVVHAIDVPTELLGKAPADERKLPLTGPTLLSVRDFKDANENFEATMAAIQGADLGARPDLWQSYDKAKPQVLARAKPVAELKTRFPARVADIDNALKSSAAAGKPEASIGYIPLVGRNIFWTVFVDRTTAEVLGFVSIDSF